jgi:hypothetical protein
MQHNIKHFKNVDCRQNKNSRLTHPCLRSESQGGGQEGLGAGGGAYVVSKQGLHKIYFLCNEQKTVPLPLKACMHRRRNSHLETILLFRRQSGILIRTTVVGIANWVLFCYSDDGA